MRRGLRGPFRRGILLVVAGAACVPPAGAPEDGAGTGAVAAAELAGAEGADAAVAALEAQVLAAAEAVLTAINTKDEALARSAVLPDARIVAVRPTGRRVSTGEEFVQQILDPGVAFLERMWDPQVRVSGSVATVWAPYDFYLDGAFSHCGVDTFQLVLEQGEWKVLSLVYNGLQPPECELHPEGPPA